MIKNYFFLFRVPQWIKNSFVFVPLLFSLNLFNTDLLLTTLAAFIVFCLTSSILYIINDISDIEADRAHPVKKLRPLAARTVSVKQAYISLFLLSIPVLISLPFFNLKFTILLISFFILNLLYSFSFKHIVLLDIFTIAAGFMLRVIGGAFAIEVEVSSWLILTTMFLSLFLAGMKRYSELRLTLNQANNDISTRKVLRNYSTRLARQISTVAASAVIICYALYTVSERTIKIFGNENLIYTTPFVVFGIFRYMYLVYITEEGENTTQIMIKDIQMILTLTLYILTAVLIIYDLL
ncbi:MAG: decaprenyl-phosphate phosphoribosyltransferase [Ignavibacteria bacterium]|nr:decaprenyl-phosphate phosphoribosyltransferase [Ignavibacteria bacterium]